MRFRKALQQIRFYLRQRSFHLCQLHCAVRDGSRPS